MDRPHSAGRGAVRRRSRLGAASIRALLGGLAIATPVGAPPITAEVGSVNHAPVAADDKASLDAGTSIEDVAPGLLFNDVDVDGDTLAATLGAPPAHGRLIVRRDGSWSYTPEPTFAGADSFTYRVSDGFLTSAPATVLITVRGPAVATAPPTSTPSARPSPTRSPTRAMPVPAALPPAGPGAESAFSVPEPAASGGAADDIGLDASAVAGLGPVAWTAPGLLLGVPGLALVVVVLGRGARRSGRLGGPRPAPAQAGAARS